jgi:hypothetical protein
MARTPARMALVAVIAGLPGSAGLAGLVGLVGACAETSPSGVVVAPVAATSSAATATPSAGDANAGGDASPGDGSPGGDAARGGEASPTSHAAAATAPARFRACSADTDCVAVSRVGCCHNGWNEAVAASQKDAYAASFVCPVAHPICAMVIVRDTRQAACDAATRLCTLR